MTYFRKSVTLYLTYTDSGLPRIFHEKFDPCPNQDGYYQKKKQEIISTEASNYMKYFILVQIIIILGLPV